MSEPVLSRKRQGAQDAVDTLETFEAFEAFDKHGLPAFVRGVDAEALYFLCARQRTCDCVVKVHCPPGRGIFADFTARMPHVRLRAMQADEHLFDYLREDLLDLVFFARQGRSFCGASYHAVRLSGAARTSSLSERAATLGPLEREDLEAFPQVLINAQPDRYRAPNSPGNGWFNPKNPDRIALVTPFFLAASLCLEETDCYAIVPKATAELALDPRRTAMLQLSDAAPKLTVRLGWHERTHADPGSQLIRAQLLALIQKRFGRPVGE